MQARANEGTAAMLDADLSLRLGDGDSGALAAGSIALLERIDARPGRRSSACRIEAPRRWSSVRPAASTAAARC
jgi:hypothetical protein